MFLVVMKKWAGKENAKLIFFLTTRQSELLKQPGKIYIMSEIYSFVVIKT